MNERDMGLKKEEPAASRAQTKEEKLAFLTLSIIDDLRSGQPLDLGKMHEAETIANRILGAEATRD